MAVGSVGDRFARVVALVRELRAPDGCPWDREQTFHSVAPLILEEVYEVIEALEAENDDELFEEVGDVLWDIVFICAIAEDEGRFTLDKVLGHLEDKIVRRHPHVWGEEKTSDPQRISELYEQVKQEEYGHKRSGPFDGVAPHLPALAKALKTVKKAQKGGVELPGVEDVAEMAEGWGEEEWGEFLFRASVVSRQQRVDLEQALRRYVQRFVEDYE